jgi:hypothetical protein
MTVRARIVLGFGVLLWGGSAGVALAGPSRAECFTRWRVTSRALPASSGIATVDCADGDPSCDADGQQDGGCTFDLSVCILQADPRVAGCVPPAALGRFVHLSRGLEPPPLLSQPGCGRTRSVRLTLRETKRGLRRASRRARFGMAAVAGGKQDVDRIALRCLPAQASCGPTTELTCPSNSGTPDAPNTVVLRPAGGGDVDLGWTGSAHSRAAGESGSLLGCLTNCDASTDPLCDLTIASTSENGAFLGPPRPLVVADVPICLFDELDAPEATGTADLSSGDLDLSLGIRTSVFLNTLDEPCPICESGSCRSGARAGSPCGIEAMAAVGDPPRSVGFSRACPPSSDALVARVVTNVNLTTGTTTLAAAPGAEAATPCTAQPEEPAGITPQADACGAEASCDADCSGDACVETRGDPVTGLPVCIDIHGGISQRCCSSDTTRACFPTRLGPLERTGKPDPPVPAWPDPNYPKASAPVAVATLCHPATGSNVIDTIVGLPGPAAVVQPLSACWLTPTATPPGDGLPPY